MFKSPSVNSGAGAIELKARYDMMKNKDLAAKPEATQYMVGANYYINPNTRVMFEYVDGTGKAASPTNNGAERDASAIQTRLQFSF